MSRYVDRDEDGNITSTWARPQHKGQEFIDGDVTPFKATTWEKVREKQSSMIRDIEWRLSRYERQGTLGVKKSETLRKYTAVLQYVEDVRSNDASKHKKPENALDALAALTEPVK